VIDLAPGADRLPALLPFLTGRAVALAVAIPTEVALLAVERSLRRALEARVAVIGLVENFASAVCGECGAEVALFREADPAQRFAAMGIDVIARFRSIPSCARRRCGPPLRDRPGRELAGGPRARGARRAHPLLPWRAGGRGMSAPARIVCAALFALAVLVASASAEAPAANPGDTAPAWAYDLPNDLMSPFCPGRSLADCPSPDAASLRMWILVQAVAGRTRADVERSSRALRRGDPLRAEGRGTRRGCLLDARRRVRGRWRAGRLVPAPCDAAESGERAAGAPARSRGREEARRAARPRGRRQ
jgi:hypothetical protein